MPQLNDRQRTIIQTLTNRQLEALALLAVGRSARERWNGRDGARSNMGGAANRMIEDLRAKGLMDRDGLTFLGAEGVLLNIGRVPELHRAEVKAAAAREKPNLERKEDERQAERQRDRIAREQRAQYRKDARAAAIPAKLRALAEEHCLMVYDLAGDPPHQEPVEARLVLLWDAIVNADAAL